MDIVRPGVRTEHDVLTSKTTNNNKMIKIQLVILLTLSNNLTARPDNNLQFLNFDFYDEDEVLSRTTEENAGGVLNYPEYSGGFNGSFLERTNRRNEYVPFNSLTLGEGKGAGDSPVFSSKFKLKNKDKIKNRNKVEWWTKKKKNKKNKKKSPLKSTNQKVRTTTTTARTTEATTKKLTTWFPSRQTTTSSYFSRPLDYQRPLNPSTQAHKVFLDTLGTEHQYFILTS